MGHDAAESVETVLAEADRDDLIRAFFEPDDDCTHNMIPVYNVVERILAAAERAAEVRALREAADEIAVLGSCASAPGECYRDHDGCALADGLRIVRDRADQIEQP